jgi:endonuclease III-like uncharacterized protein
MSEGPVRPEGMDDPWEDLVVSMLSVNQYSLERTYAAIEGLRREHIAVPSNLARWQTQEMEGRLRAAGYDRGPFMTDLFAKRLCALGALIRDKGADVCEKVIGGFDMEAIQGLLLPVHGIGPVVLRKFFVLRNLDIPPESASWPSG